MKINIVGLHKADVLLALYNNASFDGPAFASQPIMKMMARMSPPGQPEDAIKEIEKRSKSNNYYFDYIDLGSGPKPLKVDLSGFEFESSSYDKNHGEGSAKSIISALRKASITEYKKQTNENSFASLLAQIGSAIEKQESQDTSSASSVSDKKDSSPRPTR